MSPLRAYLLIALTMTGSGLGGLMLWLNQPFLSQSESLVYLIGLIIPLLLAMGFAIYLGWCSRQGATRPGSREEEAHPASGSQQNGISGEEEGAEGAAQ